MKISKLDAMDFFDHFGFIDLREQRYYPSMRLSRLKRLNNDFTPADYANMELDTARYLRPPVRNPMYIDFAAALQTGITHDTLIELGYQKRDANQEFLSAEEGVFLRKEGPSQKESDAIHSLRNYLMDTNRYGSFLSNWEAVRMKTIRDWLHNHGIEME